ncbi:transcriptional regulator [Spirochaetia bacterium]|nr:transcriptional regulator [Spirochaetia bacterium]
MGFKENLKSELAYKGLLVKELSVQSGISHHTINNYLSTNNCIPTAENAVKIAQVLDVSVEYLVTGQENSQKKSSLSPEIADLVRTVKQMNENDRKMIYGIAQLFKNNRKNRV